MNVRLLLMFLILFASCKTNSNKTDVRIEKKLKNDYLKNVIYINDYENLFNQTFKDDLSNVLKNYEEKTSRKVIVITLKKSENLNENNFYEKALNYANGTGANENSLAIILCKELRMVRICTGRLTEKILTDEICEKVLNEDMIPLFKENDYKSGIVNGINKLFNEWK